jgi:hypothetical protein
LEQVLIMQHDPLLSLACTVDKWKPEASVKIGSVKLTAPFQAIRHAMTASIPSAMASKLGAESAGSISRLPILDREGYLKERSR